MWTPPPSNHSHHSLRNDLNSLLINMLHMSPAYPVNSLSFNKLTLNACTSIMGTCDEGLKKLLLQVTVAYQYFFIT
jgi:hypothetical protein